MAQPLSTTNVHAGLTVKAYRGDGACMLAMNMEDHLTEDLAGFAIRRTSPDGKTTALKNRLSFNSAYTATTTAKKRTWWPTTVAPYQKFWWVDFPPRNVAGEYRYEVTAMRFVGEKKIKRAEKVNVALHLGPFRSSATEMGFTRGYLSSQAYAGRFHNAPYRPKKQSIDFNTKLFAKRYEWLGFHARKMIFDFLRECLNETQTRLDVFAYDLNEPDVIRMLAQFGNRLRMVLDDAALHHGKNALEDDAEKLLIQAGCQVKRGHFGRYSHNKVFIKKDKRGRSQKVLTGSTNFSVTGVYVNANNVIIFDEKKVAEQYEKVFALAFETAATRAEFLKSNFSEGEFEVALAGLPHMFISFAPHRKPTQSLERLKTELGKADSSVLFAVMGLRGSGDVLKRLREIHADPEIFSYGVCDDAGEQNPTGDVEVFRPAGKRGVLVKSAALIKNVPAPFSAEASGDGAHKIHHKFVVVDFNDSDPVLFVGSSNLAEGGEENNSDNLIAIYDREIAGVFAIEAIRLVDHYHFRAALSKATKAKPLRLKTRSEKWWTHYYNENSMKYRERLLFAR
jgi:hypothetical protein